MKPKELYLQTSLESSKQITRAYSTSFSMGIRALHRKYHDGIYAIYGFVRCADEIVDTFHDQDKAKLLAEFKATTIQSINDKMSVNPVIHSFQWAVHRYAIDLSFIEAFLISMEMDLDKTSFDTKDYTKYIYGSAEAVGLMCLKVFVDGEEAQFDRLRKLACHLGAAFQKVNFLRDMRSDYEERGRIYFPGVTWNRFSLVDKEEIEADILNDFNIAEKGIQQLPRPARKGVWLAYRYYLRLFNKIQRSAPEEVQAKRIRIPDLKKYLILLDTLLRSGSRVA